MAKAGGKATKPDPRITARRIEVNRDAGRHRLRIIGLLTIASLIVVGGIALSNSPLLDVDEVAVDGLNRTAEADVLNVLTLQIGDPLAELDLEKAQVEVETLPWVRTADVDRGWLGTVRVTIEERVPQLAISSPSGFVLVDEGGRQLEIVTAQPAEFLPVAGVTASGEIGEPAPVEVQSVLLLVDALDAQTRAEVSQVLVDERHLFLELAAGGRINLGDDAGLVEKLTSARTILDQVDLRCLWEIDVRVPTAPAVTRLSAEGIPGASLTELENCS